ncbi:MYXO-CTERM sorting domain-containing protein [Nannocystis radixulma]|uniref:MYXO-CTERM sorting domain-containing protein n=1 Tax=Nannocystis radixulma TaxID=2995305 RepID=A0ABT5B445_9BACT|nr:MYXO-CTERM sorting domain-containing protein [Nannocystis radixulma]MDC0668309.1 MYXO-CTERM sorting domain-containing protein [Nannocystis radixulma]
MLLGSLTAIAILGEGTAAAANPTYYNDQAAFAADHLFKVTDDYSNPAYVFSQNDATMSAVLGETDYKSTGFMNLNIVQQNDTYCSGCNGSFELSFQTTTIGTPEGIHGVGLQVFAHDLGVPYFAFITFADGTTANIALPAAVSFWGVAAPERIRKIHFGLTMGGATTSGSFVIDNLVIGEGCQEDADCADDDMCNGAETCEEGTCTAGTPLDCGDGNVCTDDTCDPGSGCVNSNNVAPCEDADMCTENTVCADGVCGGGNALDCADDDVCTENTCDPGSGCGNAPIDGCCKTDGDCAADQICNVDSNTCESPMTTDGETTTTTGDETTTGGVDSMTGADTTGPDTTLGPDTTTTGEPGTTAEPTGTGSGGPITTTAGPETPTTGDAGETSNGTTAVDSDSGTDSGGADDDGGCGCRQDRGDRLGGFLISLGLGLLVRRRRR